MKPFIFQLGETVALRAPVKRLTSYYAGMVSGKQGIITQYSALRESAPYPYGVAFAFGTGVNVFEFMAEDELCNIIDPNDILKGIL